MQNNQPQLRDFRIKTKRGEFLFKWADPRIFDSGEQYSIDLDAHVVRISCADTEDHRIARMAGAMMNLHDPRFAVDPKVKPKLPSCRARRAAPSETLSAAQVRRYAADFHAAAGKIMGGKARDER